MAFSIYGPNVDLGYDLASDVITKINSNISFISSIYLPEDKQRMDGSRIGFLARFGFGADESIYDLRSTLSDRYISRHVVFGLKNIDHRIKLTEPVSVCSKLLLPGIELLIQRH